MRLMRSALSTAFVIAAAIASWPVASRAQPVDDAPPPASAGTAPLPSAPPAAETATQTSLCLMVESAAVTHRLPIEFFARLIWRESRFQPGIVGPLTRSGRRAQGIAQFMPGTAAERGLLDPFDPVQALPRSAEFLSELRGQFGNLGLAAAAYNAGPRRIREWLAGSGPMPEETRNYVAAITGRTVEEWSKSGPAEPAATWPAGSNCSEMIALLTRAPNTYVARLQDRIQSGVAAPWGVQLAAGFSRDRALESYSRAMNRLASVLGDRDPLILGQVFRSRGTRPFYQVRIGVENRAEATDLCRQITKSRGACLVMRNRGMS
jgi:hypothetical protein